MYKNVCAPVIHDYLATEIETWNNYDRSVVAILNKKQNSWIYIKSPKEFSKYCTIVLVTGGKITCKVPENSQRK